MRKNTGALASITEIGKLRLKDVKWSDQNNIINATAGTETQFSPDPNAHSMLCIILSPRLSQIKIPGDKKERNRAGCLTAVHLLHTEDLFISGPKLH